MKKIKGILLFGILTLLGIGSSFGAGVNNSMSVFHMIGNSNALLISSYGQFSNNSKQVKLANGFSTYFQGGTRDGGTALFSYNSFVSPLLSITYYLKYDLSISDGIGFGLTGYYLNTDNLYNSFQLFNQMSSGELGVFNIDYNSGEDFFPLVFDLDYSYFTLVDNEIIFNGTPYGSFDFGILQYCFYGINWAFSCVYTTDNGGYNFVHFNYNTSDEYGHYFTGYLIQPLNSLNSSYSFEGTNTLIISTDSQDRIIYNIIDVYSDDVVSLSAGNVIDKGYIDTQSLSFIYRYFFGNSVLGNFAEIYEDSGTYYFRSNLIQQHSSSASSYSSYCRENINLCLVKTGLSLISNESVGNILGGNGGNGNQSTGSMAINTGLINLCLTSPSFYELNTIFCNRVFGGRDLSYYQGLVGSGAYLQSYIDGSGNLVYVIDIVEESGTLTGGVVWECYGDRCINTESGSWGDVEPWEILHLSGGDILSSGYYLGFFESINETGYFFKCPYSYNNSRWVAGRSILNAVGRDPFLPINCFIAAYENGRGVKFFDEAFNGYSQGPLINGDSQNHRNLFTFFDVLLSVALIFFLMKFYHLFK